MTDWLARARLAITNKRPDCTPKTGETEVLGVLGVPLALVCDEPRPARSPEPGPAAETRGAEIRPYMLTAAQLARAHASPWEDAAIARFQARARRFLQRGHPEQDAEDLAERLHLRDIDECGRAICLECVNLCANGRCAEAGGLPGADRWHQPVPSILMRCERFRLCGGI